MEEAHDLMRTLGVTAAELDITDTARLMLDRIDGFWDWRTQGTGRDHDRLWWASVLVSSGFHPSEWQT